MAMVWWGPAWGPTFVSVVGQQRYFSGNKVLTAINYNKLQLIPEEEHQSLPARMKAPTLRHDGASVCPASCHHLRKLADPVQPGFCTPLWKGGLWFGTGNPGLVRLLCRAILFIVCMHEVWWRVFWVCTCHQWCAAVRGVFPTVIECLLVCVNCHVTVIAHH